MNRDPSVIDVQAEVAHWQAQHSKGTLGTGKFSELSPVIKLACDVYLQAPHSTEAQRLGLFRDRLQHQFISSGTQSNYEQLAAQCWRRLGNATN
ncbi:MAG TPA: hypothetical protein DDZ67_01645 [Xanthomonadaceae bacterium]|nr:hypothetical protein [Xanthomonadaceae bacterium]